MAWTQSDLDALTRAIGLGAMSVQYADNKVTYRSLADMRSLKREMEQELGVKDSGIGSDRRVGVYRDGLDCV